MSHLRGYPVCSRLDVPACECAQVRARWLGVELQPRVDVLGIAEHELHGVVDRAGLVLPHVMRRISIAADRLTEIGLAVAELERSADDLPALLVELGVRVVMHLLPMTKDSLDALGALPTASGRALALDRF